MKTVKDKALLDKIDFLFGCDFFSDDFDPDGEEVHCDTNDELLESYDNKVILDCALEYFYERCKSVDEIINFCNLFFYYGYYEIDNPKALEFLGYIFAVINYDDYPDTYEFLDGFACSVMEHNKLASLYDDPYYAPEKDERIKKAVEAWKNKS